MTHKQGKSNSWLSIISFSVFKVRKSLAIWVLLVLSLALFGALGVALFTSSKTIYSFYANFQYGVFIFNNILLLLFILLIIIKIFGREFEDGTYLLLISKPYSRLTLFFLKIIALWFMILFFLGMIILFAYGMGHLGNMLGTQGVDQTNPGALEAQKALMAEIMQAYNQLLLKLFIYSLLLSFFASSGIIFAVTFLNSQVVLLIVVIFCSLFMIGGMPYSLLTTLGNTIDLKIENSEQPYPVRIIKSTIDFKKYLGKQKIKYPHITKAMYDFYMGKTYTEVDQVFKNSDNVASRENRLAFYASLGLATPKTIVIETQDLERWNEGWYWKAGAVPITTESIKTIINTNNTAQAKTGMSLKLNNPYYFVDQKILESSDDPIKQDVAAYMQELSSIISWDRLFSFSAYEISSLAFFGPDSEYQIGRVGTPPLGAPFKFEEANQSFKPLDVFDSMFKYATGVSQTYDYSGGEDFNDTYINFFKNRTQAAIRQLELNVTKKVTDYKLLEISKVTLNPAWTKYSSLMSTYSLISKFNIIEHWNQIWTSTIQYSPFNFNPLERSNIDFAVQNNYLMSYQDYALALDDNGRIIIDPKPFLPIELILYAYMGLSGVFLFGAYFILRSKNIT